MERHAPFWKLGGRNERMRKALPVEARQKLGLWLDKEVCLSFCTSFYLFSDK